MTAIFSPSARSATMARSPSRRSFRTTTSPWISYPAAAMTLSASFRINSCPGRNDSALMAGCSLTLTLRPCARTSTVSSSPAERYTP